MHLGLIWTGPLCPIKYKLTVISIPPGTCIQTSVLMYVIQWDLIQLQRVKYITLGGVECEQL